jgi:hypothetical protein
MVKKLWVVVFILFFVTAVQASVFLSDDLFEGDTAVYAVGDDAYYLQVTFVNGAQGVAIFALNNEKSDILKERDEFRFKDNSVVFVKSILGDSTDGRDLVEFYFAGSGKDMLPVKKDIIPAEQNLRLDYKDRCGKDCDDENSCTKDYCVRNQCAHIALGECEYEDACYNVSQRIGTVYCSADGIKDIKEDGEGCAFGYECLSKICEETCGAKEEVFEGDVELIKQDVELQKKGLFGRFFSWLRGLFA